MNEQRTDLTASGFSRETTLQRRKALQTHLPQLLTVCVELEGTSKNLVRELLVGLRNEIGNLFSPITEIPPDLLTLWNKTMATCMNNADDPDRKSMFHNLRIL